MVEPTLRYEKIDFLGEGQVNENYLELVIKNLTRKYNYMNYIFLITLFFSCQN